MDYLNSQAEKKWAEEEERPKSEASDQPSGREDGSPLVAVLAAGERVRTSREGGVQLVC